MDDSSPKLLSVSQVAYASARRRRQRRAAAAGWLAAPSHDAKVASKLKLETSSPFPKLNLDFSGKGLEWLKLLLCYDFLPRCFSEIDFFLFGYLASASIRP